MTVNLKDLPGGLVQGFPDHTKHHNAIHAALSNQRYSATADYQLVNDGTVDQSAALEAALLDIYDNGGGALVVEPRDTLPGVYRLDSSVERPPEVFVVSATASHGTWGLSGNNATTPTGAFGPDQSNVMFVSDQAIDMFQVFESGSPASQDWRGGGFVGVGFHDYSTNHNQVTAAIRVKNPNDVWIEGCSFNNMYVGSAVVFEGEAGAAQASGQYTTLTHCRGNRIYKVLEFLGDCPDVEMYNSFWYGRRDGSNNVIAGSKGVDAPSVISLRVWGGAFQYFDTMLDLNNCIAHRYFGTAFELHPSAANNNATAFIHIRGGAGKNNVFVGCDFANTGKASDTVRIDAGRDMEFISCTTGAEGQHILTTDNGERTLIVGSPSTMKTTSGSAVTITAEHRMIIYTAGGFTQTLPPVNNRAEPLTLMNRSGGTITVASNGTEPINDSVSNYSLAGQAMVTFYPGTQEWWTTTGGS